MQSKKLGYALFIGLAAMLCVLPTLAMPWYKQAVVGKEQLAPLPELVDEDGVFNSKVLNDFSDYFTNHFGFRHEMITAEHTLTGTLLQTLDSDNVLLGRDGWLFYGSTLSDYTGADRFTLRQSYAAAHTLWLIQETCEKNGMRFCFVIAPNKNSLYGSRMPSRYPAVQQRSAHLVMEELAEQGVHTVDLTEVLFDEAQPLYYRTDSHWNRQGAQRAAEVLLQELNGNAPDFELYKTGDTEPHIGDLYEMLYPAGSESEQDAAYLWDYHYDEKFRSADDITIHTENPGAEGSIYVYRDSFGINLHPFMAQSFGRACFSRNMPYRMANVTAEQPDVLLVEIVERNLYWLLERAPELPAPQRQNITATDQGKSMTAAREQGKLEGYFCVTGDLAGQQLDEDSPIYILTPLGTFEACPSGKGEQPFTAYLPEALQQEQLSAAFRSSGEWMACVLTEE